MTENFTENFAGNTRPPAFAGGLLRAFFRPAHARGVQGLSVGASAAQGVRSYRARRGVNKRGAGRSAGAEQSAAAAGAERAGAPRARGAVGAPAVLAHIGGRPAAGLAARRASVRPFHCFASFFPFFPSMRRPPARYAPRGSAFCSVGRALFVCAGGSFCTEGGGGARRRLQKPMNLSSFSLSRLTGAFNGVIRGRPKIKSQKHAQIALLFGRNMV